MVAPSFRKMEPDMKHKVYIWLIGLAAVVAFGSLFTNDNPLIWYAVGILVLISIVMYVLDFRQTRADIHLWLMIEGGWHYELDIVKAGVASGRSVYIHLTRLVDQGLIERRDEPEPDTRFIGPRPQFRAPILRSRQ